MLGCALGAYFWRYPITTLVVNGKHPSRVFAAVAGSRTLGTEIINDVELPAVQDHDPQQPEVLLSAVSASY